jgi:hypothetical protein
LRKNIFSDQKKLSTFLSENDPNEPKARALARTASEILGTVDSFSDLSQKKRALAQGTLKGFWAKAPKARPLWVIGPKK